MDRNPVTASVHVNVGWEEPHTHAPHVVVALHKRAIQTLLHDEPGRIGGGTGGRIGGGRGGRIGGVTGGRVGGGTGGRIGGGTGGRIGEG